MSAPWNISIYGSNTNYSPASKFILKTTLDGNISPSGSADVVKSDIIATWLRPEIEPDGSVIKYGTDREEGLNKLRIIYNIDLKQKSFPTTDTVTETFYNTAVLSKRYKWIWLNDYPIRPLNGASIVAGTYCIQVSFTGLSVAHNPGWKIITYSFSEADTL